MFLRTKVICPQCQSARCRRSRRHPVVESEGLKRRVWYRCLDCSYRFLSPESFDFGRRLVVSAPIAFLTIVAAVVLTFWLTRPESPSASRKAPLASSDPAIIKAAEAGDAKAQFKLGEALLQEPARSPATSEKAYHWLQLAAENGNTEAMILLGRMSRTGVGVLQNFGQAARWIQTAAERGSPEGMLELGRLYRDGIGVEKSPVMAYVWFNRASAAQNMDGVAEREVIARTLTPEDLKEAQRQSVAR